MEVRPLYPAALGIAIALAVALLLPEVRFALALIFIGGAAGKFACGWLGARLGVAILTLPLIRC